ncbi:hypothetical protein [Desulfofundulus thermobenzoicus]|uniref:hypothetical protein n=1 Tax=Desulfofundulus thermobenzoicus TaxID=29376 RepID=UPI00128FCC8A|nr:hypothetical protein [Desulfofundulus thermobenzoicus]
MELDINNYTVKFVAIIVAIFLVVYGLYAAINYYVSSKIQSFISVQVEPGESSPLPFP